MGWVGVVFKRDIANFDEFLAIGLTTGLMGSITTFTAWMQEITNLTTQGHWVRGLIGILLGNVYKLKERLIIFHFQLD